MLYPMLRARRTPAEELGAGVPDEARAAAASLNELARRARDNDAGALQAMLRALAPAVRRVCRGILGRHSPDLEDAVQDCLIEVARAVPNFRFESDISHYVTKIAIRRAIASRKRARAQSKQQAALHAHELAPDNGGGPIEPRADLVRGLMDHMNEAQATVLVLRILLGHSISEIAGITGVSVNTVKTRLRLGKDQLRKVLERRGEGRRARD